MSAADALQICTPAIQKLANRRESVVARGGACESSALVVTDGTIPLMQSVVSENGVMIYASSSREFLERSDELVGLVYGIGFYYYYRDDGLWRGCGVVLACGAA